MDIYKKPEDGRWQSSLLQHMPYFWHLYRECKMFLVNYSQRRLIAKKEKMYLGLNDQDKWIIEDVFHGKTGGYFLDVGAHDGISASNTYVLEKMYGWDGICVEANPKLFDRLKKERDCLCSHSCVDNYEREVYFFNNGAWGGIIGSDTDNSYDDRRDLLSWGKKQGLISKVKTRKLEDILRSNNAPKVIDYVDFDVEGAEERILKNFPFDEFTFLTLTIERASEEVNSILRKNGYHFATLRVGDSFYVHESLTNFDDIPKEPFKQVPPKPVPLERNYTKQMRYI